MHPRRHTNHAFGAVERETAVVQLSPLGHLVAQYWAETPAHFAHVALDEWVVMPNHFHGIIHIVDYPAQPVVPQNLAPQRSSTRPAGSLGRMRRVSSQP
ncbi:MAG: hypothetical protein IPL28_19205 [Chloroflexi bacterium]|nr:hypothetical protein [Chloroflexota bacterium]